MESNENDIIAVDGKEPQKKLLIGAGPPRVPMKNAMEGTAYNDIDNNPAGRIPVKQPPTAIVPSRIAVQQLASKGNLNDIPANNSWSDKGLRDGINLNRTTMAPQGANSTASNGSMITTLEPYEAQKNSRGQRSRKRKEELIRSALRMERECMPSFPKT